MRALPGTATAGWTPDFSWVTPTLAVGGRFPMKRAACLAREHRIVAVIDLRSEDCDDAAVLARCGLAFLHLPTDDHHAVDAAMLEEGTAFALRHLEGHHLKRGGRVLIHCEHGIGRSATLALCVLVAGGMEPMAALRLAKDRRSLVSPSVAQYHAWVAWLTAFAARNPQGWAPPHFDAFKAVAYRHLAGRSG